MISSQRVPLSLPELNEILAAERVIVHFQQILSARNHCVIGFEGLVRGLSTDGRLIPPQFLFDAAERYSLSLELDRLCREKVLASFGDLLGLHRNYLLFLNLETSFLSSKVVGSGYLLDQVVRHNVPPANIVIEFVESRTVDTGALISFVNAYRGCGLNIALDDVGTGHSNFDRISLLRPNIIKIDRSIISGITDNYFQQEILHSLANLSKSIGALTLAEGVETAEETLCCIEYGVDLLQGFYFSRPQAFPHLIPEESERKLADIALTYKARCIDMVRTRRLRNKRYQKTARCIIRAIEGNPSETFDDALKDAMMAYDFIDALYIVNEEGIQQTNTVMRKSVSQGVNPIFHAASKNENLSHKDYFYQLINTDLKKYTTDRYLSFATGNLCITLSHLFKGGDDHRYILCVDFLVDDYAV